MPSLCNANVKKKIATIYKDTHHPLAYVPISVMGNAAPEPFFLRNTLLAARDARLAGVEGLESSAVGSTCFCAIGITLR